MRRASAPLIERLLREPYRFEFFQAVRLAERCFTRDRALAAGTRDARGELAPGEALRFRAIQRSSFPASDTIALRVGEDRSGGESLEMAVSFLGLTGPNGVLPPHYTRLVLGLLRERDEALRDFLDIFHHRLIALFYESWAKHRVFVGFTGASEAREDAFTRTVRSIAGLSFSPPRARLDPIRAALLFHAGLLADDRRPPDALAQMASAHFGVPVEIECFRGRWIELEPDDRTRLCRPASSFAGATLPANALGKTAILGGRVWEIESKFRVRVGPLRKADFLRFVPPGDAFDALSKLVRAYVGMELDFDLQVLLESGEALDSQLGGGRVEDSRRPSDGGSAGHRLGRNASLRRCRAEVPFESAVFEARV